VKCARAFSTVNDGEDCAANPIFDGKVGGVLLSAPVFIRPVRIIFAEHTFHAGYDSPACLNCSLTQLRSDRLVDEDTFSDLR
jgi:hypothetical protein